MSSRTNTFSWKTLIRAAIKDSKFIRLVECWKNFYTSNWPHEDHIWIVPLIYGDSTTLIANLFINCNWNSSQSPPSFLSIVPNELLRLRNKYAHHVNFLAARAHLYLNNSMACTYNVVYLLSKHEVPSTSLNMQLCSYAATQLCWDKLKRPTPRVYHLTYNIVEYRLWEMGFSFPPECSRNCHIRNRTARGI